MKKLLKIASFVLIVLIIALVVSFFTLIPRYAADSLNPVINRSPYSVSEKATAIHQKLLVADLHADSLLWKRDLNQKDSIGQVDIPRLEEGNVALQAFTVVTKSPKGLNIERNDDQSDNIFWLALSEMQPWANLSSLTGRAVFQANKLLKFADQSGGKLNIIKSKKDMQSFLEKRKTEKIVGGWLGIEGAHALDGKVENVDVLFEAGFRMMSPSHFFDTEMGGSAHGVEKYGLTEKGKEMIRRMEQKKMFVDLAHASKQTIDDVLAIATRPVIVSHTGVKGTCDNNRNLSDDQLKAIAKTGGVVGIGFWDTAVCGDDAKSIAVAIRYTANVVGVGQVALGSDFDGSVKVPFDASGLGLITEALLNEGFSEEDIAKIMGGNVIKLLSENLPD